MPPERTTTAGRKPFKPPRPSTTSTSSKTGSKSQSASKPRPSGSSRLSGSFVNSSAQIQSQPQTDLDFSQSQDEDDVGSSGRRGEVVVVDEDPSSDAKAKIPSELLTRILHEMMKENGNEASRIGKTADKVVAKYVDCFVREAIARAVWERREAEERERGGRGLGGGFLEVEDLEKLAPQLVLDF